MRALLTAVCAEALAREDYFRVPGYSRRLADTLHIKSPANQFSFWTVSMAAVGTSIYAATRFRYAKLLHKAVYLQKVSPPEHIFALHCHAAVTRQYARAILHAAKLKLRRLPWQ